MTILVIGSTGTIGRALLQELSERGERVKALSRTPPSAVDLPGLDWVRSDLADPEEMESHFEGIDRLFLLTGNGEGLVRLQKNAVELAADAGVSRIVKLSALGASDHSNSVIGVWHWVVERALQESGVASTILRPHVFMQNVLDQKDGIWTAGVVRSPAGDAAIPMVDTRDVAAVAAAVLTEEGHEEKRYTLTGPAPVSWQEVASILSRVLGRPVEYRPESEPEAFVRLHEAGLPAWHIGARLALAEYQRRGGGTSIVTDAVERLTGSPPRTFEDFAKDHQEHFEDPIRGR